MKRFAAAILAATALLIPLTTSASAHAADQPDDGGSSHGAVIPQRPTASLLAPMCADNGNTVVRVRLSNRGVGHTTRFTTRHQTQTIAVTREDRLRSNRARVARYQIGQGQSAQVTVRVGRQILLNKFIRAALCH